MYQYCGKHWTEDDIERIREIIAGQPKANRESISRLVCSAFDWRRINGEFNLMSCKVAMIRMCRDGLITLPAPSRRTARPRKVFESVASDPQPAAVFSITELVDLRLELITHKKQRSLWNEYIGRYHYLGYRIMPGAQLRYFIVDGGRVLGAMGFGGAAWKVAPRDCFIGWTAEQRQRRLHRIVNQTRFLILPWIHCPNLARWPIPHPCAHFEYYVPQTFIEVMPDPKESYFGFLPGAAFQLATVGGLPYGKEADNDTQSYQAHTIAVPLAMIPFNLLPCGGARVEKYCFDGMSEHLGSNWNTGSADLLQPQFLAWSLSPKACMIKGAVESAVGGTSPSFRPGSPVCSYPMSWLPKYPPSSHEACNGWGLFYPRVGTYDGPSQTIGALMVASRMKSLSSEVFNNRKCSYFTLF